MATFNLVWMNTAVVINPNVTGQRISYRKKGDTTWITTGFTPSNDLPKTAYAAISPNLSTNIVWQFKVEALCTVGGPIINDNGIIEGVVYECATPSLSHGSSTATITLNIAGTNISRAEFTLHLDSDDSIVSGPISVDPSGTAITTTVTGLTPSTAYYWTFQVFAVVGGVETSSADTGNLGQNCQSSVFTTDPDLCAPITALTSIATEY